MKRSEQELVRIEKLHKLQSLNIDPYGQRFDFVDNTETLKKENDQFSKEELAEKEIPVKIAGRIMTWRSAGKAIFANIKDEQGQIQIYIKKQLLTEEELQVLDLVDIGDIIGLEGIMFKTNHGELTVYVHKYTHLSKAVRPLPEKFHGLQDIEERQRRRYVDLIVNDDSREVFKKRSAMILELRKYLDTLGYMEVETPVLTASVSGASAKPFMTHHNALDMEFALRIATELPLKRLLVGGFNKVYEIGRIFRNEGVSVKHNPEFTSIELYQAFGDMETMMDITENIISHLALHVNHTSDVTYDGHEISLAKGFKRIHMVDAVKELTGLDFWNEWTFEDAKAVVEEKGIKLESFENTVGHIINILFEEYVEETLEQPTFIYGHPVEISPLAKKNAEDGRFTDRFELFILGREYANAFTELNDPFDQAERFQAQMDEKDFGNEEATDFDHDYIEALEYAMPPAGGLGIGIDRLIMLLTDSSSIRDVLLFPHMKDKK